jgi:DnaJ-domain-containing protein 1
MRSRADERHPVPLSCWFCDLRFTSRDVVKDGILRSRSGKEGGPYWIFLCPHCLRENCCERTARGRWFASPNCRLTFLETVFSQIFDGGTESAETILAALSWLRANEDRRRYFFERDGDSRYGKESWLRRLWPWARPSASIAAGEHEGQPQGGSEGRRGPGTSRLRAQGPRGEGEPPREEGPPRRSFVGPHEVLGIRRDATLKEIRDAFRRLAIQYHPDKVAHLGEEFERIANEKFLRLKEAYEILLAREARRPDAG